VIFNVEKSGITNENHFRWLYTGLSRAKEKILLINYKHISPFDKADLIDQHSDIPTSEYFYVAESQVNENRLSEFKDFVTSKLILSQAQIERVENLNWQERYHVMKNGVKTVISFGYNGQGQFRLPTLTGGDPAFGNEIIDSLKIKNNSSVFIVVRDIWRKNQYEALGKELSNKNIFVSQIVQTSYKDKLKLYDDSERQIDIEIDYNGDGAFSRITAKYYSDQTIWDKIKQTICLMRE
jgi:hypothetical protein